MCEAIDSKSVREKSTLNKLYEVANIYYNYTGTATCFNLDDDSDPHDLGGWQWQVHFYSLPFLTSIRDESSSRPTT